MQTIKLKYVRATKINKTARNIINLISIVKRVLNVPDRRVLIKVSDHLADFGQNPLTKSIVTELTTRKGIQTINVKTDIDFRCLCKIYTYENKEKIQISPYSIDSL